MSGSPQLQKVSDVLKSVEIPKEINIVIAPAMPIEAMEFWEMIDVYVCCDICFMMDSTCVYIFNRLRKKSNHVTQLRLQYPTAPVLSQKLERSCNSKNEELLSIVVQIGQSMSTIFQCPCIKHCYNFSIDIIAYIYVVM